jgi:hypothetical protein
MFGTKKKFTFGSLIFTAVILVGVGILLYLGGREPSVTIENDTTLRISGMYGTRVPLDEITNVSILNQSMRDIGAGARTNGFNGSMWRGRFEAGLLFVRPDASPTLRIERVGNSPIFISFSDGQDTFNLYNDLTNLDQ